MLTQPPVLSPEEWAALSPGEQEQRRVLGRSARKTRRSQEREALRGIPCAACGADPPPVAKVRRTDGSVWCLNCRATATRTEQFALHALGRLDGTLSLRVQSNIQTYLRGKARPCTDCGCRYSRFAMEYDHLDRSTKLRRVSDLVARSGEKLLAEMAKCEVVCSVCHAVREARRDGRLSVL